MGRAVLLLLLLVHWTFFLITTYNCIHCYHLYDPSYKTLSLIITLWYQWFTIDVNIRHMLVMILLQYKYIRRYIIFSWLTSSNWEGSVSIRRYRLWMGRVLLRSYTGGVFVATVIASRQVKSSLDSIKPHVRSVTSITFVWSILSLLIASSRIHATTSNDFWIALTFMVMLW